MSSEQVPYFRATIIAIALAAILTQFLVIPRAASDYAEKFPELAYLERPYVLTLGVALIGLVVALVAAWQLVSIASGPRNSTNRWTVWLTTMTLSLCFAALVIAGLCAHAGAIVNVGGPPMLLGIIVSLGVVAGSIVFWVKTRFYTPSEANQPMTRDSVSEK